MKTDRQIVQSATGSRHRNGVPDVAGANVHGRDAHAPLVAEHPVNPGSSRVRGLVGGAVAGLAATWLMGKVTSYLYEHEDMAVRQKEDDARGGKTAYGVAAEKVAGMAGVSLSDDERKRAGTTIHWALGAAAGAVYGAVKDGNSEISPLRGLGFGMAFWAIMDETVTPLMGLTPGPTAFPLQTHARGLAGHLIFGASVDAALAAINSAA